MAPPNTTQGKKSLLRPWGSRRRDRPPRGDRSQEPPLSSAPLSAAGPSDDGAARNAPPSPDDGGHSDPIDQIASVLLDDSDGQAPREAQTGAPSITTAGPPPPPLPSASRGQIPRSKTGLPSPFTMHPVFPNPEAAAAAQSAAGPAVGRGSRPILPQSSSVQFPAGSLKQPKVRLPPNPLPRSRTTAFHPHQQAEGFGTLPFHPAREPVEAELSPLELDARQVDEKVRAMLAATDALKSKASQDKPCSTAKPSNSVPSRVLNKVSNVWDRFHARAKLQKRPSQGESSSPMPQLLPLQNPYQRPPNVLPEPAPLDDDDDDDDYAGIPGPSAGTISRRRAVRRPAAYLAQSDQLADIFSDEQPPLLQVPNPYANHPSPYDTRPCPEDKRPRQEGKMLAEEEPANPGVVVENPFETEAGFDSNLEDGILSTPPVAASTPKMQSRSNSFAYSTDDSALDRGYSDVQIDLARVAIRVGDEGDGPGRARQSRAANRVSQIRGSDKVKKHPSPSKKDLEDLEQAFQRKEAVSKPVLRSKDANRLMRAASSRLHDADPLGLQSPWSTRKSRLPQRFDGSLKLRREVPFAALSRHVAARYDDYDELH